MSLSREIIAACNLISSKSRVVVSLAPSYKVGFSDFTKSQMIVALKRLGFWGVSETLLGVHFVCGKIAATIHESFSLEKGQKLYLTSACPAAVEYVKTKESDFIPYLTKCESPLGEHAKFLRQLYGSDTGIVFIGPCNAKKIEAEKSGLVDVVLTFTQLREWFKSEGLFFPTSCQYEGSSSFIPFDSHLDSSMSVDGGITTSFSSYGIEIDVVIVSGLNEISNLLKGICVSDLIKPLLVIMLSCHGGCMKCASLSDAKAASNKEL